MAIYQCVIYLQAIRCPCMQMFAWYARIWGGDSTSQFAGHGKKTTMKLLLETPAFLESMCSMGSEFVPTENILQQAERSICIMYKSTKYTSTNDVRNSNWNCSTKDITKLPPCHDSAVLHIRRVNYQAAIWRLSLLADITPHHLMVIAERFVDQRSRSFG